jgi:hypothetical protein
MRESGLTAATARMATGDIFSLAAANVPGVLDESGIVTPFTGDISGLTAAYTGSDVAFLVLDARTGQLAVNDASGFVIAAGARQEITVTIALRVVKNTDANPLTYEVNDTTLRHSVVFYKNPS